MCKLAMKNGEVVNYILLANQFRSPKFLLEDLKVITCKSNNLFQKIFQSTKGKRGYGYMYSVGSQLLVAKILDLLASDISLCSMQVWTLTFS